MNKYPQYSKAHKAQAEKNRAFGKVRRPGCDNKRPYSSQTSAESAGAAKPGGHGYAYHCKHCEQWHWTSMTTDQHAMLTDGDRARAARAAGRSLVMNHLIPARLDLSWLATYLDVGFEEVCQICEGHREITDEMDRKLSLHFGTEVGYWRAYQRGDYL